MSSNRKEIILKSLIVISLGSFALIIFVYPIVSSFIRVNNLDLIVYSTLALCFATGILFMILLPFYGSALKQKPVKAEKYKVSFKSNDPILTQLENAIKRQCYEQTTLKSSSEDPNGTFYCRLRYWTLVCISIVVVDELSIETVSDINHKYQQLIDEIYGSKKNDRVTAHISLFLINQENAVSSKLVNSNIVQRYQRIYLPAYILNSSGVFFVARQKDGFGTSKYRQLRKELREIIQRIEGE
jgi:hypothetical protein